MLGKSWNGDNHILACRGSHAPAIAMLHSPVKKGGDQGKVCRMCGLASPLLGRVFCNLSSKGDMLARTPAKGGIDAAR